MILNAFIIPCYTQYLFLSLNNIWILGKWMIPLLFIVKKMKIKHLKRKIAILPSDLIIYAQCSVLKWKSNWKLPKSMIPLL